MKNQLNDKQWEYLSKWLDVEIKSVSRETWAAILADLNRMSYAERNDTSNKKDFQLIVGEKYCISSVYEDHEATCVGINPYNKTHPFVVVPNWPAFPNIIFQYNAKGECFTKATIQNYSLKPYKTN